MEIRSSGQAFTGRHLQNEMQGKRMAAKSAMVAEQACAQLRTSPGPRMIARREMRCGYELA